MKLKKPTKKYILLSDGEELDLGFTIERATELRQTKWEFKKYKAGQALKDKNSGSTRPYIGQNYDPTKMEIINDGWTHAHCEICFAKIADGETEEESEIDGFHSDLDWICNNCYSTFIEPTEQADGLKKLSIIEK
tara:strand:- start:477 stop:881 length:405 start_codon:yes stop_codon:yes gene_type:complete